MLSGLLVIAACAASYLIGAIPFGLLVARARGVDIRTVGSGNIGATNVFRCVGKSWGSLVYVLDMLKGLMPTVVFPLLIGSHTTLPPEALKLACGVAAVAGHNWPVYLKFKGGKGVATTTGVLLGVSPTAMGLGLLVWVLAFVTSRYVSVASMAAAVVVGISAWWLERDARLIPPTLTLLALFILWRHRANVQRLRQGTESRMVFRKKN